jgi:hypothetical protein
MVIISNYELEFNKENGRFTVVVGAISYCPLCQSLLVYRESVLRYGKREGGGRIPYVLRKLKCTGCRSTHRELIDKFAPYKHYEADVISGSIDEIITCGDLDSEDYPCETTMTRWKEWFDLNKPNIEGILRSTSHVMLGLDESILATKKPLLEEFRRLRSNWLEFILQFIYNLGNSLLPINHCGSSP